MSGHPTDSSAVAEPKLFDLGDMMEHGLLKARGFSPNLRGELRFAGKAGMGC